MATTQAERIFTAVAVAPRAREAARIVVPAREGSPARPAARGAAWALARDAAGGVVVLGSWVALWTWFLAATW